MKFCELYNDKLFNIILISNININIKFAAAITLNYKLSFKFIN